MDIDKEFIRAVVRGGKPAVLAAIDRDIDKEFDIGREKGSYLAGDGKKAWTFLRGHFSKYDEVPSLDVIQSRLGIDLDGAANESYEFFLDEIFNRRLWQLQRHGTKSVSEKLESKDPAGAAEVWLEINRKIQEEALTVRKVESLLSLGKSLISDYKDAKAGKRGIATPWPSMDNQTLGWWPEDLVLFVGRLGVGKCISSSSLCTDPKTGIQRTIEQICTDDITSSISTWDKSNGIHSVPITAKVDTGTKECIRVTLSTGRSIDVTSEHPLLTTSGWKRADALKIGDSVGLPDSMPFPASPLPINDDELDLIALSITDKDQRNSTAKDKRIKDSKILGIAERIANKIGVSARSIFKKNNRPIEHIPEIIFRLNRTQLAKFMTILFMRSSRVKKGVYFTFSTKVINQIQSLLLRFGIHGKSFSIRDKKNNSSILRIYTSSLKHILASFDIWGDLRNKIDRIISEYPADMEHGFPVVSDEVRSEIENIFIDKQTSWNEGALKKMGMLSDSKMSHATRMLFGYDNLLNIDQFKVFCKNYDCEEKYRWLWDSGIFWDRISSISSVGEKKIYDLTVNPTSCFIGNDIILHNTWSLVICAHKAWQSGSKVLVVSTEMNKMQMARRFFALHLKLPYDDIRRGRLGEFVESKFFQGVEEMINDGGINIVAGDFDYSIDNIATVISDTKPNLMCLDGAYLIKNTGKDRHERVSNTFDDLKKIGKRTGIATITNLQFNRAAKTGQSQTIAADNIGITDVAAWNADAAYGLVQSDEMRANWQMGLKGMKIREGMPDEFLINWNHGAMDFSEIGGSNVAITAATAPSKNTSTSGADSSFATEEDNFDDMPF
jgi:intein/homing endonuclease